MLRRTEGSTNLLFPLVCDRFEGAEYDGEESHEHDAGVGDGLARGSRLVLGCFILDGLLKRLVDLRYHVARCARHVYSRERPPYAQRE